MKVPIKIRAIDKDGNKLFFEIEKFLSNGCDTKKVSLLIGYDADGN